jgi:hypothetical protein
MSYAGLRADGGRVKFNSASEAPSQRGVHGGYTYGYNYRLQPTFEPLQVRRPWQSLKLDTLSHLTTVGIFLYYSVCREFNSMQWWIRPAPLGPHNLPASAGSKGALEVRERAVAPPMKKKKNGTFR